MDDSTPPARSTRRRAPSPEERRVDAARTRQALLDAALEEFAAKGFAGARVRDIACRAGVSKDLIAYHFGGKEGIYREVQREWLQREADFAEPGLPLTDLMDRYLHDALADPRRLRLLLWRGLGAVGDPPPDASEGHADLTTTRARQAGGELPDDIEPAALRLILVAIVSAPVTFPDMTRELFGTAPSDPEFEARYARALHRLIKRLGGRGGSAGRS